MHPHLANLLACASLLVASTPLQAAVPTEGLVARYDFSGDARDSAGAHDGEIHGAKPTPDRFGKSGEAYAFDGAKSYIEIADADIFSVSNTGKFSVSVWMRPDSLTFPAEGSGYVHWLGKGENGRHEWTFRMYSSDNVERRANRTSFYAFNLSGGLGAGSYVQDPVTTGQWFHFVALVDVAANTIRLYKNGVLRDTDSLSGFSIVPQNGTAPVRIGTRDLGSYFTGAIDSLYFYDRLLTEAEIQSLHADTPPPDSSPRSHRYKTRARSFR